MTLALSRRRVLGGGLAATSVLAAAACGAPSSGGQPAVATGADQAAKLLVKIRSGPTYETAFKEGITLFKQKFPKTEIDYFPEESGWQDKLLAGWAAGAG